MDGLTVTNPVIPYYGEIPQGLYQGKIIHINGFIPSSCYRFTVELKSGYSNEPNANTALHISVRFDEKCVVRNSHINGNWQNEDRLPNTLPLQQNSVFEMILLTEDTHYKIAINGRHFTEFQHRLPVNAIKCLSIHGEVKVSQIVYHSNFMMQTPTTPFPPGSNYQSSNPSTFSICPPGPAKYKMQPVYNPPVPFLYTFHNGLEADTLISISGRPTPSARRFTINLNSGSDIALHFNVRFDQRKVVKNTLINNTWGNEDISPLVFAAGVNFDLTIAVYGHGMHLTLNGQFYGQYPHRIMPVKKISNMSVDGDVLLTSVRFF